uniref:DDE Tnp4 domain-containing protein n=1 Tax=Cyprinodon variegatus TaxID=28743 RepID=A0A3Q2D8D5_CYPVA
RPLPYFCCAYRRVGMKERSEHWWLYIMKNRMSYRAFKWLCESLSPHVSKAETKMRQPIPVQQKVGAVFWFLGTTSHYWTIAHLFGISTASLSTHLYRDIMESFKEKWGYPTCIRANDGSHIPTVAPKESRVDYFNRKGWYSITHDARVLVNSRLYQFWENGVFPHLQTEIHGVMVPPIILCDPAYPLLPWLMKPYPENAGTTEAPKKYNLIHSRNRMVVENAFGRLKGRWRRLLKRVDNKTSNSQNVITTQGEDFLDQWANEANQPPRKNLVDGDNNPDINNAHNIRNALCRYFADQN